MPNGCDVMPVIQNATMTIIEAPEKKSVDALLSFDQETMTLNVFKTWDLSLYDQTIKVQIDVTTDLEVSDWTEFHISYLSDGPEFVNSLDDLDIKVLTCSYDDEGWSVLLPAIKAAEQQKIEISLAVTDLSKFMVYIDQKKTIFLNPSSKKKLFTGDVSGDICLETNTYDVEIELISDALPSSTYTIQVSVEPIDETNRVFNAGKRRKEELVQAEIILPEIEIRKISFEAVLTI